MNTALVLAGWNVVLMPDGHKDYGEIAKRIVRHGLAAHFTDFVKWAGDPGPSPDAETVYFSSEKRIMYVTQNTLDNINRYVFAGAKIKLPHNNTMWPSQDMYPDDSGDGGIDVYSL